VGDVRVRFAPSPTGYFHVGGARTALYNWLFARQRGGAFVLRIEDTDPERSRDEWIEGILEALRWLGLDWDEGPYRQSERMDRHREAALRLVEAGHAYRCDCTPDAVRVRAGGEEVRPYDGFCRDRGLGPGPGRVVRFRVPDEGVTVVRDLIRGRPEFENARIEDFVIVRSDGTPVFVLANAVDDLDMRITHVVRGEEHLPTTPKYVLIRQALGEAEPPVFAHLPLLVNEQRRKLSKRRDRVSLEDYRSQGYLPDAMVNYLALLGWAPRGDREFLSIEELVAEFDLTAVNPSPAFFDVRKLNHFNGHYVRSRPLERFVLESEPWLRGAEGTGYERADLDLYARVAPLVQTRIETMAQIPDLCAFLFVERPEIDPEAWERTFGSPGAVEVLRDAADAYAGCPWDAATLKDVTAAVGERHGLKLSKAQAPVRVAVTGRTVGLPLFESLEVLGRQRTLERISQALDRLASVAS
jgi:glutamyl-tRNA synthetase